MARPSDYNATTAAAICLRLVDGESLRTICKADDMPAKSTVLRWLVSHEEFARQYTLARKLQAEDYFEQILEVAFNDEGDISEGEGGRLIVNHENINRSRLKVDSLKWVSSKLAPEKYGDRIETVLTPNDGKHDISPEPLSSDEWQKLYGGSGAPGKANGRSGLN